MSTEMFKEKLLENKHFKYILLTLIFSVISMLASVFHRTEHWFIPEAEGLSKDSSKRDFCTMALNQMIHKKLSKKIIASGLYELVTADNYKNLFFDEEDKVSSVYSGEDSCKVLVKTKDGLRSLDLFLEEGDDPEFHYQIRKIHENELYEKES